MPYVFTEQGVAMLSSALNSETAIQVNNQIIGLFTKMTTDSRQQRSLDENRKNRTAFAEK